MKVKVTLSIEDELIQKAKIYAIKNKKTVSEIVEDAFRALRE